MAKHELLTSVAWSACLPSKSKIDRYPRLKPQQNKFELFHNKSSVYIELIFYKTMKVSQFINGY